MFKFFDPGFECFANYNAFCSHTFDLRVQGVSLIAIEEVRNYRKIVYINKVFENGWREDVCSSSYAPGSTPGHKLQKPSKQCGIFQSLGTINFVLFY